MKQKIKTRKSAAKRFKITGTGKVLRKQSGMRHLLAHESSRKKRNKHQELSVTKADQKKVKRMLPYN